MKNEIAHKNALKYILAGKSYVCLHSEKTGNSFWYFIRADNKKLDSWVVYAHYSSGIKETMLYKINKPNGYPVIYLTNTIKGRDFLREEYMRAFSYVFGALRGGHQIDSRVHILHEGRCGYCGRPLTDPISIDFGIGPICRKYLGYES